MCLQEWESVCNAVLIRCGFLGHFVVVVIRSGNGDRSNSSRSRCSRSSSSSIKSSLAAAVVMVYACNDIKRYAEQYSSDGSISVGSLVVLLAEVGIEVVVLEV